MIAHCLNLIRCPIRIWSSEFDALLQFSSTSAGVLFVIFNIVKDINAEKRPSLLDGGIFSWGWRPLDSFLHENKSPEMKMIRKWNESHYFGEENYVLMIGVFSIIKFGDGKSALNYQNQHRCFQRLSNFPDEKMHVKIHFGSIQLCNYRGLVWMYFKSVLIIIGIW